MAPPLTVRLLVLCCVVFLCLIVHAEILSAELLFKTYDSDGSGDIDSPELSHLLKDLFAVRASRV